MALYVPIKGHEVEEEEEEVDEEQGIIILKATDSVINKNHHDEDVVVEMSTTAAGCVCKSRSSSALNGATAYSHAAIVDVASSLPCSVNKSSPRHLGRQQQQQQRLVSLDVFRGLTVALMILVDDVGGLVPAINHAPWDGLTLADLVMPFFLFMVGVSLSLVYKKLSCRGIATRKALLRGMKLIALGIFLQGGFFHGIKELTFGVDITKMRWMGILQRIGIGYLVAALCEIWLQGHGTVTAGSSLFRKYKFQLIVASLLTVTYLSLSYGLRVPDWEYQIPTGSSSSPKTFFVKCGVRGDTGPACNAVGMIDRKLLGLQHLYGRPIYSRTEQCSMNSPDYGPLPDDAPSWCQAPFDPEGILSSLMAIVTCLVGLHYGHVVNHFKDHRNRVLHWTISSTTLVVLGLALDLFGMHINKALYSFSYTCITAGAAGIIFAGIYLMVDVCGYRRPTIVMEWMGKHALAIFVLVACNLLPVIVHGFYWGKPQNNILTLIGIGKK